MVYRGIYITPLALLFYFNQNISIFIYRRDKLSPRTISSKARPFVFPDAIQSDQPSHTTRCCYNHCPAATLFDCHMTSKHHAYRRTDTTLAHCRKSLPHHLHYLMSDILIRSHHTTATLLCCAVTYITQANTLQYSYIEMKLRGTKNSVPLMGGAEMINS